MCATTDGRRTLAVVRPFAPNFAELAPYGALTRDFKVTYFYTGPAIEEARRQLAALGLGDIRVVRYASYTDVIRSSAIQRIIDFKIGFGSTMASGLDDVLSHDIINIVDPLYHFTEQIARRLRPEQKLMVVRWELIPDRYDAVWLARRRARPVLARADAIVCTTEAARSSLSPLLRGNRRDVRIDVIHPGISLCQTAVKASHHEHRTVVTVARLQWQKGIDDLLGAAAIVLSDDRLRDVRFQVIGNGDLRRWRSRATRLGLTENVDFIGALSHTETLQRIASASVYCQPSAVSKTWCEQFGFAVVEAMFLGRPVVACDSGALSEIIGPDGVYAATRNAASLARGLCKVLLHPTDAEDRGQRLAEYARNRYDAQRQGNKMRELLNAL